MSGNSLQMSHGGTHENGVYSLAVCQSVLSYDCHTKEKRHPISTDMVSWARGDGGTYVDDASLQMGISLNFVRLERDQEVALEAKTQRRGNGPPRPPWQAFDVPHTKRITRGGW